MSRRLEQWLTSRAESRLESVAIVFGEERVTYGALDQSSNRLARTLKDAGCSRGDRVALLLPKSPGALTGMFGAIKAGCMYVPMDTSSPAARLGRILQICETRCVLAVESTAPLLNEIAAGPGLDPETRIVWMDRGGPVEGHSGRQFSWNEVESASAARSETAGDERDPAHILFTSGSTGTPKGVVITHANVIAFVDWALRYFDMQPSDRISGHPPLHFDLSTFDIYGTIAAGAQIHLLPPEVSILPHRLAEFIRNAELTQWFSVPSILHNMAKFDAVRPNDFPSLKRLLWCGEKFTTPALMYWMEKLPHASFVNLYGPTEATIASSYYRVPSHPANDTDEIPIGQACGGERLLVLDEKLRPAAAGETGDLYIGGAGLSPGYWRDPEKTNQVFFDTAAEGRIYKTGDLARTGADGLIYLLGRSDTQIKSRGYRIELGEIEAALHAAEGIQNAAVVAVEAGGFEGLSICCAYVPSPGAEISPLALKKTLARVLPHYMLPTRWMALKDLPLNGNGKVARPALKEMFASEAALTKAAAAPERLA
ncbi:MAG: amino acid adenylation domain-containing protein [Bryobacteraceae bacterium]